MADVAAVIGNYEGEALLPDVLASIRAQTLTVTEVVVVDAGSQDRSREVAERHDARFVAADNRGLGRLYNMGSRAVDAELVLLANNDVSFDPECAARLVDALEATPTAFAADPVQESWDGGLVIHGRTVIRRAPLLRRPLPGFDVDDRVTASAVVPTVLAHGAAMLVRRDRLLALGGFDETFFLEFEEIDLCWRAWLRGWETLHVPNARVRHRVGGVTLRDVRGRRLRSAHHNLLRFALKCLPTRAAGRVVFGELLRLPRHPALVVPALARVSTELPEILRLRAALGPKDRAYNRLLALADEH